MLYSPCELCSLVPHSVVLWRESVCLWCVCGTERRVCSGVLFFLLPLVQTVSVAPIDKDTHKHCYHHH